MPEIIWVGPGWYKLLSFAVGKKKVVQVSQNKQAQIEGASWCATISNCEEKFSGKRLVQSKREVY